MYAGLLSSGQGAHDPAWCLHARSRGERATRVIHILHSTGPRAPEHNARDAAGMRRVQLTGLWRHPDRLKLWGGQTSALFGSQVTYLALT